MKNSHDGKEEHLALGTQEGGESRMLGTWVGRRQDLEQRKKRGRYALITIKKRLKNARLTKTTQAMIIQAVVKPTMTCNCEIRPWQKIEIREMQQIVDHGYRYVWMKKKKGPALKQTEEKQVNMWGMRKSLGVRSLQAKIEERELGRIGTVLRMENTRPPKRVTLGWYVPPVTPTPERKPRHGTLEYWRKILNETGLDAESIEHLVWDRSNWREIIRKRTRHRRMGRRASKVSWESTFMDVKIAKEL